MTVGLRPVVVEHEQPDGRRQIAVRASGIDLGDEIRPRVVAADGDFLEPSPEGVFKADAGLMTGDDDRALDDWRFHCLSPVSTRCRSRLRWALSLRDCVVVRSALVRPWAKRLAAAFCSASRRLACFRAVRRLTVSPIRSLGGNRITWLGPSWPASAVKLYAGTLTLDHDHRESTESLPWRSGRDQSLFLLPGRNISFPPNISGRSGSADTGRIFVMTGYLVVIPEVD